MYAPTTYSSLHTPFCQPFLHFLPLPLSVVPGAALQEIKAAKLQQKVASKTILELQRNLTAQHAERAAEVAALSGRLEQASWAAGCGAALQALALS